MTVLLLLWLGIHAEARAKRHPSALRIQARLAAAAAPSAGFTRRLMIAELGTYAGPAALPPWFRPKPSSGGAVRDRGADPREPLPEYRCKTASDSQCSDTSPNLCSSQASELRERKRRYGRLADPSGIGMSLPVLASALPRGPADPAKTSTVLVALERSALGLKWKLTW